MVDWMPRKWRRNGWTNASRDPVANADLWRRLAALAAERTVEWAWVRGHDGDPLNDEAHRLASEELRLRTGLAG
jgi:ribonuclease HI